jgi:serine/threonine-protein kinase
MAAGWALRADYVVSGMLMVRGDSLAVVTMLTDVRTGRFSKAAETAVPLTDPARAFEPARKQVAAWLDTASILAARRGPPRPPSGYDLPRR